MNIQVNRKAHLCDEENQIASEMSEKGSRKRRRHSRVDESEDNECTRPADLNQSIV